MKSISFLIKSSLDTDPAGRDIILWRNISFRDSTIEGSRFSPTIDSAMSERVEIGSPCNCLTALCWKREITVTSAFVRLLHNSEP